LTHPFENSEPELGLLRANAAPADPLRCDDARLASQRTHGFVPDRSERRERASVISGCGGTAQRGTRRHTERASGRTHKELYQEAAKRNVPGRSRMNKAELARSLHH